MEKMLTRESVIECLQNYNKLKLAREVGLHHNQIYRLVNGQTADKVSYSTIKKLSDYFQAKNHL